MDLMDLAGPDRKNLTHDALYDRIIDALGGPEALAPYLPYRTTDALLAAYQIDPDFNAAPLHARYLSIWDKAAGFRIADKPMQPPTYVPDDGPFQTFLRSRGVTWTTLGQSVCLLKRAAARTLRSKGLGTQPVQPDEAIIIQPYQDLLTAYGPLPGMRRKYGLLRNVDPDTIYVLVPFALGRPGGLTRLQADKLVAALSEGPDRIPGAVSAFHERLCIDDDVRPWIDGLPDRN